MVNEKKENQIIFYDPPRRFTLFDIILTLYGVSMTALAIYWNFYPPDDAPALAFVFLAVLHIFIALFPISIYLGDKYTFIFDYRQQKAICHKKGMFGSSSEEFDFKQIQGFHIVQNFDPDTVEGWDIEMEMKSGERRAVPNSFASNEKAYEQVVERLNNHLNK